MRNIHFILFLFPCLLFGQNETTRGLHSRTTDSLQKALSVSKEDSNKVNILYELSKELLYAGDFLRARPLAKEASILSRKIGYIKGEEKAFNNIGVSYQFEGNYAEALKYFFVSIDIVKKRGDKIGI